MDNVAKDILYKTLDKNTLRKITIYKMAKEIGKKLIQLYEGNDQTMKNKLSVATQKFDNIKMKYGESMNDLDERVSDIINELNAFEKSYQTKK